MNTTTTTSNMASATATPSSGTSNDDPYLIDHFHPLRLASLQILAALRSDENSPQGDLYRRLSSNASTSISTSASGDSVTGTGIGVGNSTTTAGRSHCYHVVKDSTGYEVPSEMSRSGTQIDQNGIGHANTQKNSSNDNSNNSDPVGSPVNILRGTRSAPYVAKTTGFSHYGASSSTSPDTPRRSNPESSTLLPPSSTLQYDRSIPLPELLAQEIKKAKVSTFMGLLAEAHLVWITCDDKLFLWSYRTDSDASSTFVHNIFGGRWGTGNETEANGDKLAASSESPPLSWKGTTGVPQDHYHHGIQQDICSFIVPGGQCVISVGLVRPKRGVFNNAVEWCIVVTTSEEAILCVLARENISDGNEGVKNDNTNDIDNPYIATRNGNATALRLIPTRFILPTDSIPQLSICGSKDGRIFMGGYDGCLYEMCYEGLIYEDGHTHSQYSSYYSGGRASSEWLEAAIDNYFDGDGVFRLSPQAASGGRKMLTERVISGGKRVLSALTFGSLNDSSSISERLRKCRKINHSSVSSSVLSAVVPGTLIRVAQGIFGSNAEVVARKGGPIISMVLDEERHCLYTLGGNGLICAYDLSPLSVSSSGSSSGETQITLYNDFTSSPRLACVFNAVASAKLYLDCVSRGRMYPPNTSQSIEFGNIIFPGGVESAQAGVGGMEGAREILKRYDAETRSGIAPSTLLRTDRNDAGILHPVSIHLLPVVESKLLTLVAVTGGGLRYYLSSLSSSFEYSLRGRDSSMTRSRLSKQMTLCHIRAPPPYISGDGNDDFRLEVTPNSLNLFGVGKAGNAISPGIHNLQRVRDAQTGSVRRDVVKSYYDKGVFVLALDLDIGKNYIDKSISSSNFFSMISDERKLRRKSTGDALLAVSPMYAAESIDCYSMKDHTTSSAYSSIGSSSSRMIPGGISENVTLPMSGAGGTRSPVLPGGRTFDIASQSNRQSSVMRLFLNSETPTDVDLQVGLMPSFTSPKTKRQDLPKGSGESSAIVAAYDKRRGVMSSLLSALSSYLRSGQTSGTEVRTILDCSNGFGTLASYRVSLRSGCDIVGFSNSSGEIASSALRTSKPRGSDYQPLSTKSARLPSWLLRPAAVPLNFQAYMHLLSSNSGSIIILNAGGLHVLKNSSLLQNLASALYRSSNVSKNDLVQNFFSSYGYAEGCAMCFALATCSSMSASLRHKAEQAALTHAHIPSMVLVGSGDGRDPLSAYNFRPSSLYEGLVKFSSRLLRPFWYKPAVVVTEGRSIHSNSSYANYYPALPAKVELLLDDYTLDEIRRPLILIQTMMKKTFVPAVHSIPGIAIKDFTDSMDVDEDRSSERLITRALQKHSFTAKRTSSQNQSHELTSDELRTIAFRTEERNMHSLYRLLSRCVQILNLMTCLKRAHISHALPEVQWGLLHGLTFYQLVTSSEGQQRIENLLNSLFSHSENFPASNLTKEGDHIVDLLSRQCYLFFSAASRLTYLGFKSAKDALARSLSSPQREILANHAASYLRAAARHWCDPALVVGRIVSKDSSRSWEDIAISAFDAGSPLALAANVLMELRNFEGLADVCFICAANFGGTKVLRDERKELGEPPAADMFDWEKGLYHQPPKKHAGENSSAQSIVSGFDVSLSDALKTCHGILFYHIKKVLGESNAVNISVTEGLLAACTSSSDVSFLHALYELLVGLNHIDTLLRIDSSTLENWLINEKKDTQLLWRYFSFHGRNILAGDIMWQRALERNESIHLDQRIECLTRAANSFSAALQSSQSGTSVTKLADHESGFDFQEPRVLIKDLKARIIQIKEQLDVATIQRRILTIVEQTENSSLGSEKMSELSFSLINVSDIYNEYACPMNLFDICLAIMETCHHNDHDTISTLWKSIICDEVIPCETKFEHALDFLGALKIGSMLEEETVAISKNNEGTLQKFENGEWIPCLRHRVVQLGKDVFGKGADYTFPIDMILKELEGLRHAYNQTQEENYASYPWPAQIMIEVGVPYYAILEAYNSFLSHNDDLVGVHTPTRLQCLEIISELLDLWVTAALLDIGCSYSGMDSSNRHAASVQLAQAINQGRLLDHIDSYKSAIESLRNEHSEVIERVYSCFTNIEEKIQMNFI